MFVNHAILEGVGETPKGTPGRKYRGLFKIVDVSSEFFDPQAGLKVGDIVIVQYRDLKRFKYRRYGQERNVFKSLAHIDSMQKHLPPEVKEDK